MNPDHRDVNLDLVLVSPHVDVESLGTRDGPLRDSTPLKESGAIVYCNGRNGFWVAFAEKDDDDDDDDTEEAPSVARRPRRGAVAPLKPVKSPEEIAALPCFVQDALTRGRPVLDDDAQSFRAHYSCFERNRTDPNKTRRRPSELTPWEKFHEEHGDFYPPDYNRPPGGFSPKDPPTGSYVA